MADLSLLRWAHAFRSDHKLLTSVSLFYVDFGTDSYITHEFHGYSQTDILDHNRTKDCWTTMDLKVFLQSSLDECFAAHYNSLDMIGCVHRHDQNISGILEDCFHQERDRFTPDEWEIIFYITLGHLIFPWLLFWLYELLFGTWKICLSYFLFLLLQ